MKINWKKKTNLVSALISAFSVTSIRYGWPNIPKEIPQFRTFISLFTIFIIHTEWKMFKSSVIWVFYILHQLTWYFVHAKPKHSKRLELRPIFTFTILLIQLFYNCFNFSILIFQIALISTIVSIKSLGVILTG